MPLGIVSDEDFQKEINNSSTKESIKIPPPKVDMEPSKNNDELGPIVTSDALIKRFGPGRHEGDVNVPQSLRKLIGEEHHINGRKAGMELASQFGISAASSSAYESPEISSQLSDANKSDITSFLINRKNKISKRAINKLGLAISLINEDKLKDLKATDLSNVAKNMADVVKKMEPETKDDGDKSPVQFIMYAPVVKHESVYEVVTAKDNY